MPESDFAKATKCHHCGELVYKSGWCPNCTLWPINVTPRRFCERSHPVDPSGWCKECHEYVLTALLPGRGEWTDTREVVKRLPAQENQQRLRTLTAVLSESMGGRRIMPVREDCAPAWLVRAGIEVGRTPMGYRILGPPSAASGEDRPELPACWEAHVERLERQGLTRAAAQMQAFSLVHERGHAGLCVLRGGEVEEQPAPIPRAEDPGERDQVPELVEAPW